MLNVVLGVIVLLSFVGLAVILAGENWGLAIQAVAMAVLIGAVAWITKSAGSGSRK